MCHEAFWLFLLGSFCAGMLLGGGLVVMAHPNYWR